MEGPKRNAFGLLVAVQLLCCLAGCRSTDVAKMSADQSILVTQGDVQRPYRVLGHVSASQSGWYLLAFIPIVPINLQDLLNWALPQAALEMGADAILFMRFEVMPSSILRFNALFIPDWSCSASATGMAVKFLGSDANPESPQHVR